MASDQRGSTDEVRPGDETQRIIRDTERHSSTRISGRGGNEVLETTVFKFRDPRSTRARIYKACEGLPWAITDLARKANAAIDSGEVEGQPISPGDVVQAAVVSYFCGGKVHKPQTRDGSPGIATLPYRIEIAEGGYWVAEPALPPETLIHFRIPETVGDMIPNLSPDERGEVLVSLQIREATHRSVDELAAEAVDAFEAAAVQTIDDPTEDGDTFMRFVEKGLSSGCSGNEVSGEWADLTSHLDDVARDEDASTRIRRKLSERRNTDMLDFGFGKGSG